MLLDDTIYNYENDLRMLKIVLVDNTIEKYVDVNDYTITLDDMLKQNGIDMHIYDIRLNDIQQHEENLKLFFVAELARENVTILLTKKEIGQVHIMYNYNLYTHNVDLNDFRISVYDFLVEHNYDITNCYVQFLNATQNKMRMKNDFIAELARGDVTIMIYTNSTTMFMFILCCIIGVVIIFSIFF